MKVLLAFLVLISVLCFSSSYSQAKTPEEIAAEQVAADQKTWEALSLQLESLRVSNRPAESITVIDNALKTPHPFASWTDSHTWVMQYYRTLAVANGGLSGKVDGAACLAAIDYAQNAVKTTTWVTITHPQERIYATLWLMYHYAGNDAAAQSGLDSWIAVCSPAEATQAWGCKGSCAFESGKGADCINFYSHALLDNPGFYGNDDACYGIWLRIENFAKKVLTDEEYLTLCKKVMRAYPTGTTIPEDWPKLLGRVDYWRQILQ